MPDARDKHPDIDGVSPADVAIVALAERQHGVVAFRQLEALGIRRGAVEHRLAAGRLHRRYKGVYAVGRPSLTTKGHWMAVVLACGPGAALCHRSAAALWGLGRDGWKTDVSVPGDRRSRGMIKVHRARLRPEDVSTHDGVPVTTVARTLLDLAAILTRNQLIRAIEAAERNELFDLRQVEAVAARYPRRSGTVALRAALADYCDPLDTHSDLERDFEGLIRKAALPDPQMNVILEGFEVDAFWPPSRLVVELDSRGYHLSPRAFENDRARDATLQRAGYRVIRLTSRRLRDDPSGVVELLAELTSATRPRRSAAGIRVRRPAVS
jgi:very-short-patch-repair endonuclease